MVTNTANRRDDKGTGIWQAPGVPVVVEYSKQVLEELRAAAEDGFQKIPHGGIEIGAILLGTRESGVVRVLEWRPIECEHAKGPGFVLSPKDLIGLEALLDHCREAPELRTLVPVGWFHTHTRSKIFLSPDDLGIHHRFFPKPDDVALVMRLTKDQPATAGFFVRDSNGLIETDASPLELTVVPDPSALLGPTRLTAARRGSPARRDRPRPATETAAPAQAPHQAAPIEIPQPSLALPRIAERRAPSQQPAQPQGWFSFGKAAVGLGLAAGLALVGWMVMSLWQTKPVTASLKLEEVDGQLEVRWDHGSRAVRNADRGIVTIQDGSQRRGIDLTGEDVRRGTVFYTRRAEDLQVRLELYKGDEVVLQEMARFVGQAIPARNHNRGGGRNRAREEAGQLKVRIADEIKRGKELEKKLEGARREAAKR